MTFEKRIHDYCLRSDVVYERILSLSCEKDLYILYPLKLSDEQILKDNIQKMQKVIREYIGELKLYSKYMRKADEFYFDSQKQPMKNEAYKHQKRADELAEIMNDGISPYAWYSRECEGCYVVYLDKI